MSLHVTDSQILKSPPLVKNKILPINVWKISFDNKSIEKIDLFCISHDLLVRAALPIRSAHFDDPIVVYTLTNTIESKIFNLNQLDNNLDVKAFMDYNSTSPCEITGS